MESTTTPRTIGLAVTAVMAAAIAYGIASGGFVDGLRTVLEDPWGQVTMIDLVLGFVIFGSWIRLREGSTGRAAPWWVALAFTGNLAAGIYLIVAARRAGSINELLTGQS